MQHGETQSKRILSVRLAKIIFAKFFTIQLIFAKFFTIQLIFATIHGSHYTFWYYSWVPLYYFS